MIRLLRIEFFKLRNFRAFWILIAMYTLGLTLTLLLFEVILNNFFSQMAPGLGQVWDIYSFPGVWQFETWFAGFFHYILSVIIIILICNEFGFKTIRQNVINGMSRLEFLMGKLLLIAALALVSTLVVFTISMIQGLTHSSSGEMDMMFRSFSFVPAFFLQAVSYMLLAFVIGILVRRTGIAIGITLIYQ
ncbi:MAG: ABC transporter permease, partial [Bacteroidota bacterium]